MKIPVQSECSNYDPDMLVVIESHNYLIFFVSEYTKVDKKHCYSDRYGNYSTIQSAKIACLSDGNCQGVYDNGCNGKTSGIHLCPISATYSNSFGSCIYQKNENSKCFKSFCFNICNKNNKSMLSF